MTINCEELLNRDFGTLEQSYSERDTILYVLGVGLDQDPLNEDCLRFVYEDGLKALPSQSAVLAYPGFWATKNLILESTGSRCFMQVKK